MATRHLLEARTVRPVSDDHAAERVVGGERVEQQLVSLRAVEAADRQDEVVVALRAVRKLLRRVGHQLGLQTRRALEPPCDVPRGCEELARLRERDTIEPLHRTARSAVLRRLAELPELCAVELVRLTKLVQQPDDLVFVPSLPWRCSTN